MRRRATAAAVAGFRFAYRPVLAVGWLAQCGAAYLLAWTVDGIELSDLTDDEAAP